MKKQLTALFLAAVAITLCISFSFAKIEVVTNEEISEARGVEFPLMIYQDSGSKYYYATGWMGDYSDLNLNQNCSVNPASGKTCMKFTYTAKKKQGKGWVGIFWQNPMNNWGSIKGGFNLTGAKKLFFMARGENGGETVELKMGGLSGGAFSDTTTASTGSIKLTKEWKQYSIDLTGLDLSRIIGGFCVLLNSMASPEGCVFYLDDIYYSADDAPIAR